MSWWNVPNPQQSGPHPTTGDPTRAPATAATCRHNGCRYPATHYPSASVWMTGKRFEHAPVMLIPCVPLCLEHASEAGWLTEGARDTIGQQAAAGSRTVAMLGLDWPRALYRGVGIVEGFHPHTRQPIDIPPGYQSGGIINPQGPGSPGSPGNPDPFP